ncbi:MAG: HNH endonuclease [Deltaproteobacteria bacterium]|nr:HNH endonuclease [Deltaproteobacteria bacterium]
MNEISKLKDKELVEKFGVLVREEKEATASVVAHLSEIDRRKLYALEGYSSLFNYCVEKYHYSESAAYRRIQAARIYPKFPEILNLLKEGKLNLVTLSLIEPYLDQQGTELINKILDKSKREVEDILSELSLRKENIQDVIRRLPMKRAVLEKTAQNFTSTGGSEKIGKNEVQEIRKVKIEFVADEEVAKLIQRAKEVLRHKYPQGKLEDLVREAFELLLEKKDPERKIQRDSSAALRPQNDKSNTRYIPQRIKEAIWKRDEGQCSYVSSDGKSCGERNFLELDHVQPWSLGGSSTLENLRLLCRTHNQWRAEKTFPEKNYKKSWH